MGSVVASGQRAAGLLDIARELASLESAPRVGERTCENPPCGGAAGSGVGFGAVECARGRLHHLAQITSDGRIGDYRTLLQRKGNVMRTVFVFEVSWPPLWRDGRMGRRGSAPVAASTSR